MSAKNPLQAKYLFASLPAVALSFTAAAQFWSGPYWGDSMPRSGSRHGGYAAPMLPYSYGYPPAVAQQPYYVPPYPYGKSYRGGGGNTLWNRAPLGVFSGPWDRGPWNSGWMNNRRWQRNNFFDSWPGSWMDPEDPRGGMSKMWDDLLEAPGEMGEMPGGWTAPTIKVPNPVDVGDEFEATSRKAPKEAADQMNNFRFN